MAKADSGKGNKNNAQKAAPRHEDSEIKDLKERQPKPDLSKIKGGTAKKIV